MALTTSERQARYKQRLKDAAMIDPYDSELKAKQIAALEKAVNELRLAAGQPMIQIPKAREKRSQTPREGNI